MTRGKGTNTRYVTNIMPEDDSPPHSLLVVEVITPGGTPRPIRRTSTTSDDLPAESYPGGNLLSPPQPAAGLCLAARLYRRPLAGRDDGGGGRGRDAGAEGLPPRARPCTATISIISTSWPGRSGPWKFHNAREHEWLFTGV